MIDAGERVPTLELDGADGGHYRLHEALAAGPVLLTFFQLDCQTCEMSYVLWDRAYVEYAGDRFQLWAVALDPRAEAEAFWEKSGVSFPVLCGGPDLVEPWQLVSTPGHALVDVDGTVLSSFEAFDRAAWNAALATVAGRLDRPAIAVGPAEAPDFRPGCTILV